MNNLTRAERADRNHDFNTYYKSQHDAEARRIRIEEQIEAKMQEGEMFYPYSPDNLSEALSQMKLVDVNQLGALAHLAKKAGTAKSKIKMADFILKKSEAYWEEVARFVIDRDGLCD